MLTAVIWVVSAFTLTGPSTDLDIVGGMRSRYRLTNNPGGQTGA